MNCPKCHCAGWFEVLHVVEGEKLLHRLLCPNCRASFDAPPSSSAEFDPMAAARFFSEAGQAAHKRAEGFAALLRRWLEQYPKPPYYATSLLRALAEDTRRALGETPAETVSERCHREHLQACHICEDAGCGDNDNPAFKPAIPPPSPPSSMGEYLSLSHDEKMRLLKARTESLREEEPGDSKDAWERRAWACRKDRDEKEALYQRWHRTAGEFLARAEKAETNAEMADECLAEIERVLLTTKCTHGHKHEKGTVAPMFYPEWIMDAIRTVEARAEAAEKEVAALRERLEGVKEKALYAIRTERTLRSNGLASPVALVGALTALNAALLAGKEGK